MTVSVNQVQPYSLLALRVDLPDWLSELPGLRKFFWLKMMRLFGFRNWKDLLLAVGFDLSTSF